MKLKKEIDMFLKECEEKSEISKYLIQGLKMVNLIALLMATYRDGNWK